MARWDHTMFYNPDPDSWKMSSFERVVTNIKHAAFLEGIELFDNKFFGLNAANAANTQPDQRLALEVGYEAVYEAGYDKKSMAGKYVGVYMATGRETWAETMKDALPPGGDGGGST